MPAIELDEKTFKRITKRARPFIDLTPASVIEAMLDRLDEIDGAKYSGVEFGKVTKPNSSDTSARRIFRGGQLPNVKHTKLISFWVRGEQIGVSKWNDAAKHMLKQAFYRYRRVNEVADKFAANIKEGTIDGDGFSRVDGVPFSFQGVDANRALSIISEIARDIQSPVKIVVQWRDKDGAEHPGEKAMIELL